MVRLGCSGRVRDGFQRVVRRKGQKKRACRYGFTCLHKDLNHRAAGIGQNYVLHLHGLDHGDFLALGDDIPDRHMYFLRHRLHWRAQYVGTGMYLYSVDLSLWLGHKEPVLPTLPCNQI